MSSPEPERTDPTREEALLRVMRILEENPEISQRELAGAVGVSLGKINYCLRSLLDRGLIKVQNFRNSGNKLAYAYLLTPIGVAEKASMAAKFLKSKVLEYEALRQEIDELKKVAGE